MESEVRLSMVSVILLRQNRLMTTAFVEQICRLEERTNSADTRLLQEQGASEAARDEIRSLRAQVCALIHVIHPLARYFQESKLLFVVSPY